MAFFLLHIFDIAISKEISNPTTTMTGFRGFLVCFCCSFVIFDRLCDFLLVGILFDKKK